MPAIREWWCLRLIERFETEGHGKRFAHWTEEARCLTEGTLRPLYRSSPGLTHDLPQHVVARRNRKLSNQALVDFIVARGTDNHIQSIINGQKKSQWLDTFSKCSIKKVPVPLFIEDQEQIDIIYTHLTSILNSTPTHTHSDQIRFIMDVLFPESIICALAVVEHVSILEAEEKFLRGPVIDASEREHFDSRIKKKQLKKSGKP
ncbi:PWWP domain-containing DNA repair factor 3A-like [Megalobrama amblycephala]|uniref:PWWP domain-containing DNA repair factor 3A-like n=1 Tax=Megalobrama amblycephala TaxID=75352 RepID=UPI0020142232|nr:PWWP domain-containing DNA repair factor 3A-like [Megalobrama amblycephala]